MDPLQFQGKPNTRPTRQAVTPAARIWRRATAAARTLFRGFVRWRLRRATIRDLSLLSDDSLADIGLCRIDLPAFADEVARRLTAEDARARAEPVSISPRGETRRRPSPRPTTTGDDTADCLAGCG